MKVRALMTGFFDGNRRRAGDVFDVPDGTKARWFVKIIDDDEQAGGDKGGKAQGESGGRHAKKSTSTSSSDEQAGGDKP